MSKWISLMTAVLVTVSTSAHAQSAECSTQKLALEARIYKSLANDMQSIADDFRSYHESATKDARTSLMIAVSSMTLLFAAEAVIGAGGTAVGYGVVGRSAFAHASFIEALPQLIASKIKNDFVSFLPVAISPLVSMPYINTVVASTLVDLKVPDINEDREEQLRQIALLNEEQVTQELEQRNRLQGELVAAAPNQFLDGLTLGSLDKKWTYKTYANMQRIADLNKQLAAIKADKLIQCQ